MTRRDGSRMVVSGPVTFANVRQVLEQGMQELQEGVTTVDLGQVSELDSSLLAAMLAWLREARDRQRELVFVNTPDDLTTLARLYGVEGLLPVTRPVH